MPSGGGRVGARAVLERGRELAAQRWRRLGWGGGERRRRCAGHGETVLEAGGVASELGEGVGEAVRGQQAEVAHDGAQQHHVSLVEARPRDLAGRRGRRRVLQVPPLEEDEARLLRRRADRLAHERAARLSKAGSAWVAAGAGPACSSSVRARWRTVCSMISSCRGCPCPAATLELVAHGEQLLRLEVELHAPHAGGVRCAALWWVRCGCAVQVGDRRVGATSREGEHGEGGACAVCKPRRVGVQSGAPTGSCCLRAHVWRRGITRECSTSSTPSAPFRATSWSFCPSAGPSPLEEEAGLGTREPCPAAITNPPRRRSLSFSQQAFSFRPAGVSFTKTCRGKLWTAEHIAALCRYKPTPTPP